MNLMGQYASANHALIHDKIAKNLKAEVIAGVENHHNFAWKETHGGKEVIVHRKGATPAAEGVHGRHPRLDGVARFRRPRARRRASLDSASPRRRPAHEPHRGAGKIPLEPHQADPRTGRREPALAGIDECPLAYKDIHEVMKQQSDLVDVVARFDPKIVRMADAGEKPED
jgi:tRNA-splicing ligase RtcB